MEWFWWEKPSAFTDKADLRILGLTAMWPQANATQQRNPLTRVSPPRAAAATRITTNAGRRGGSSSTPNTPTPGRTFASFDFISGKPAAIAVASTAPPSARGRGSFTPSRSTHGTISNGSSRATPPGRVAGGVSRDQRGRGRGFANRSMVFNTATTRNQPAPVASNPVDSVQFSDEPMSLDGVDQFGNGTDFDDGQEKELSSIVASTRDASNFSFLRPKQQQRTPNGASAGAVLAPMITATPDRLPGAASIRTPPPVKPAAASKFLSAPPKLQANRADRFTTGPQGNKYLEMSKQRESLRLAYIKAGKMSDPTAKVALSDAIVFVGECEDMCPEFERHEREFQKGLHEFEKIEGTEFADHDRCVKRYRRSAAGDPVPMPCDVRPPRVLVKTLDYLLHTVIPERTLEAAQPFIRDRCRSIRNDFTLQNYRGIEAVECHERIARFHILSAFKFCNHPVISLQQEQEQMRKTLQSLREYYVDLRSTGIESLNEPEFHAYYILSHLWQNEVVSTLETILPPAIFSHPHIQLAIEFQQLAQCLTDTSTRARPPRCPGSMNFFTRFFRMCFAPTTPFLFACLLHQEFYAIRKAALRGMHTRSYYNLPPHFPVRDLLDPLGFDDEEEAVSFLEAHGVRCDREDFEGEWVAMIGKQPGSQGVKKPVFEESPSPPLLPRTSLRIEEKAAGVEITAVIDGLQPEPRNVPRQSFVPAIIPPPRRVSTQKVPDIRKVLSPTTEEIPPSFGRNSSSTHLPIPSPGSPLVFKPSMNKRSTSESITRTRKPSYTKPDVGLNSEHPPSSILFPPQPPSFGLPATPTPVWQDRFEFRAPDPLLSVPFTAVQAKTLSQPLPAPAPAPHPTPITIVTKRTSTSPTRAIAKLPSQSKPPLPINASPPTQQELSLLNALIGAELRRTAVEALIIDNHARAVLSSVINSVTLNMTEDIAAEEIMMQMESVRTAEDFDAARVERAVVRTWLKAARRRAEEKERRRQERVRRVQRFFWNVLETGVGSPIGAVAVAGWRTKAEARGYDETSLYLPSFNEACFAPLDLALELGVSLIAKDSSTRGPLKSFALKPPALASTAPVFFKLAISTPSIDSPSSALSKFATLWTRSKLGSAAGVESTSEEIRKGVIREEIGRSVAEVWDINIDAQRTKNVVRRSRKKRMVEVIVEHLEVAKGTELHGMEMKHNSDAALSGANAALFQFSLPTEQTKLSTWWTENRTRLYTMLLYLPLLADIPLLLLFVPTPTLSLLEFKKAAPSELSIASFLSSCGGPISMVEVAELNLREGDSHDLNGALSRLQEGLNWSIEFGGGTLVMRDNILKDLATTGTAESITFAFGKVDESVPTSEFSIDVDNHMKTFNTLVDLYNIQVDAVITLLTHPSSTHAPFPAPNFTPVVGPHRLPPLTWNAPATVDFIVRALSAFRLPHMTAPKGAGPIHQRNRRRPGQAGSLQTVKELYDTYATRIATGAVPGHAWSLSPPSLIPSIWSRLAPFTHSYGLLSPAPRFPFKSVASCIAAAAWAALEEEVRRVGSLVGGGTSGPWYDARGLPGVVQAVSEKASEVLSTWMEQVVNVWAPSSSDDEELANGGLEANGTGDGGHDASVATNGVILANTSPPGSQKRRLAAITVANAETALPSSPTAKALKRRLDEIIASAREEVESSKRRFSEL